MRFSDNGYYIESYVKCENCGLLVYDEGVKGRTEDSASLIYCSPWCREWHAERASGVESPRIDLPFDPAT